MEPVDPAGDARAPHFVQSLARGLSVLTAFGEGAEHLTLSEVAARTDLTRAAARRFLLTLVDLGYVTSDGKRFTLRPRVLDLGYAYLSGLGLPAVAQPHLERLVAQVRESSSMAVLDGHDVVYVARVPTARIMSVTIDVGTRLPAHATSLGRVLLAGLGPDALERWIDGATLARFTDRTLTDPAALRADLDRARTRGHAIADSELEDGLRSVAVPVRDRHGVVAAALNVSTQASRVPLEDLRGVVLPALAAAARAVEDDLSRRG
ncbi:MAG: IclR family transcriptional regulator C-terminal domain-containing protein [Nocardioidaceae bacterium]|nr:IclR family transcriptional regulator C-terminal domain-containing protein [Nocardioidaceae bacterium]